MLCKAMITNPEDDLVFVFFNGFGSDYKFWENLIPYFLNYNYVLLSENYFEYPEDYDEDYLSEILTGKTIIGVGHSLGYHKLCELAQKYDFFKMKKIVSIEGFSRYLGRFDEKQLHFLPGTDSAQFHAHVRRANARNSLKTE